MSLCCGCRYVVCGQLGKQEHNDHFTVATIVSCGCDGGGDGDAFLAAQCLPSLLYY